MTFAHLIVNWRAAVYDGVRGVPPDWVPQHQRAHFSAVQTDLCHGVASGELVYGKVIAKVQWYASAIGRRMGRFHAGMSGDTDFFFLGDLLHAVEEGKRQSVEAGLKQLLGAELTSDAKRGEKIRKSAVLGHETVHGTPEDKAARRARYKQEVDSLSRAYPRLSPTRVNQLVAKKFEVSPKTIWRSIRNQN